ncbi:MAG: YjbE family putative metal transport protein [Rhizomicrobium sp.]
MLDIFANGGWFALIQVILIDIVLAGDNALVIGMSAAQLKPQDRHRVIFWGLAIAVLLRIVLAICAVELLQFTPAMLAGGLLLLWVCWRLYRDIRHQECCCKNGEETKSILDEKLPHAKALRRAIVSIAIADLSMSLDNVLAVAGAAMHHLPVLVIGLALSIALMGLAANVIAKLLNRYSWISYAGVIIVLLVALRMIWHGIERLIEDGWLGWLEPVMHGIGA